MDRKKALAIAVVTEIESRKSRHRRMWVKDWLLRRNRRSHVALIRELGGFPEDYRNYLRMTEDTYIFLLNKISNNIKKNDTIMRQATSPHERLSSTLRYLATGCTLENLKFSTRISPQALSKIIPETCQVIFEILKVDYLKFPKCKDDWKAIARQFDLRWNFPNCGGAVDGKHIRIKKPPNSGSHFYNYKHVFSVVLLGIVNASYEFIYVDCGVNGRISDGGVIETTKFYEKLRNGTLNLPSSEESIEQLNFVFIGDEAFALHEHFMKPYAARELDHDKKIFNYRLSRARRIVENAFGILASRFGIFHTEISLSLNSVDYIVLAACVLHNFLKKTSSGYCTLLDLDAENVEHRTVLPGEWKQHISNNMVKLGKNPIRNVSQNAKTTRDKYKQYFNTIGRVAWQEESINR